MNAESDMVQPDLVANYLLAASRARGEVITNLKLQKLLYYAQAWHLALKDKPLFLEDFEAWVHGPVLRSQYDRFKGYSWKPITDALPPIQISKEVRAHLDSILNVFGSETAIALEAMTHREEPWREARGGLPPDEPSTNKISKQTMTRFYKALAAL